MTSKLPLLLLAAWAFAGSMRAQPIVDVWPENKMPGHGAELPESDLPARSDGFQRTTNVSRPTLKIFPAPKTDAPAQALIVCPGGGYGHLVQDKEGSEIATWLNAHGISAVVLKYRVPGNREGALQDLQRALSLTRAHAAEWNIDPRRLGVIGFSAGGHLSAKTSTCAGERTYAAIDDVDKQSCRPDFAVLVYPGNLAKINGELAPDLKIHANIPPTLMLQSEDDTKLIPGTKLYAAALSAAEVPNKLIVYPTGGHGYGLHCKLDARAWPEACLEWLHQIPLK